MSVNAQALEAELRAINLWDRLFAESEQPDTIAKDACATRFFRRLQVIVHWQWLNCASGGHLAASRREKEVRHERSLI
jgi:hypothetical protein